MVIMDEELVGIYGYVYGDVDVLDNAIVEHVARYKNKPAEEYARWLAMVPVVTQAIREYVTKQVTPGSEAGKYQIQRAKVTV